MHVSWGSNKGRRRENISSRLTAKRGAQCEVQADNPWDLDLSRNHESMLNPLSQEGAPLFLKKIKNK